MIPRAVETVFKVAKDMESKGWNYKMEGQFLEIVRFTLNHFLHASANNYLQYNETINDLLGKGEFDKKKHEVKHEKGSTRVTDVVVGECVIFTN